MQPVHLRINDAATGQPTPARLRITDSAGVYYAPFGRLTDFATGPNQDVGGNVMIGMKKWAYIDGTCEILLPPGELRVEIAKGPEYQPVDEPVQLLAGKLALRFTIERWSDVRKHGWHSGDTRVHFLPPDAALLEGQAEGVAVVNLLVRETTVKDTFGKVQRACPNILSFSGQSFARQADTCSVAVNTQNMHPELGSLGLLHCHRLVYPLNFDSGEWTLEDWCGQCHRKKGLVVWTEPQHQTDDFLYGEPLADLILGNIDAFELTFWEDSPFDALVDYYKLLQAGLIVPLTGASGKDCNGLAIGSMRMYAYLPPGENFTYSNWIEAVRAGRTFASNGPLLHITIDGAVPSRTHDRSTSNQPMQLRVEASSWTAFDRLDLLFNGEVIAKASPSASPPFHARIEQEFDPPANGWLAARCSGQALIPSRPAPQRVFAHTSAVAVRTNDKKDTVRADVVNDLLGELDGMLRWAREEASCDKPVQRERLVRVFSEARTVLAGRLS